MAPKKHSNQWISLQINEAKKQPNLVIVRSPLTLHFLTDCKQTKLVKQSKNKKKKQCYA